MVNSFCKNKILVLLLVVLVVSILPLHAVVEGKTLEIQSMGLNSTETLWTDTEIVSTVSTSNADDPSLAVDGAGNVHIAWADMTDYLGAGTDRDIFYTFWNSTSGKWNTTEVVSIVSTGTSDMPSLAVDGAGNVHIAWEDMTDYLGAGTDRDIFYTFWNSTSGKWNTTEVVSIVSIIHSYTPSLTVDGVGNVHIAWRDPTPYAGAGADSDIFYTFWNSTSGNWNTTEVVSIVSTGNSYTPSLAVDGAGNVHIAWRDVTDYLGAGTDWDIFYTFWNSTSENWNTTEVVSIVSTGTSIMLSLAMDGAGNVHIVWSDMTDYLGCGTDFDIFYTFWNSTSGNWNTTEVVSIVSTGIAYESSLAVDSTGNVHIAWFDDTNYLGCGTDFDIFYTFWNSTSGNWNTTEVVSTVSSDDSYRSSLAVDTSGNVHIAWADDTDYLGCGTDTDIFYRNLVVLDAPTLQEISPNPSSTGIITLNWNDVVNAKQYYVYRSTTPIGSVEGHVPVATVMVSTYEDLSLPNGTYYYVVVASNAYLNATSNEVWVVVEIPPVIPELFLLSIFITLGVVNGLMLITLIIRKKKQV